MIQFLLILCFIILVVQAIFINILFKQTKHPPFEKEAKRAINGIGMDVGFLQDKIFDKIKALESYLGIKYEEKIEEDLNAERPKILVKHYIKNGQAKKRGRPPKQQ